MLDDNETIGDKPGGLASILGKIGLIDIIHNQHQIDDSTSTYARGSKRIDYIFGTSKVQSHCKKSRMLPFGVGYQSDHGALFIKVVLSSILQTTVKQIDSITARKLTQATPKERTLFLESVDKYFTNQNLYQRLKKLTAIKGTEWSATHTEEFEKCDKTMVDGMLAAELSTKKIYTTSWSPTFAKAVMKKMFRKIALSLKTNHRRAFPEYLEWSLQLSLINFQLMDTVTVK
jgi:hypothetical protein